MTERDIEGQILALSEVLVEHLKGQHVAVAMGALMNMVMTIAQNAHPSPAFHGHMAYSFRQIADQLDQIGRPKQ